VDLRHGAEQSGCAMSIHELQQQSQRVYRSAVREYRLRRIEITVRESRRESDAEIRAAIRQAMSIGHQCVEAGNR
jgi:phosphate uptake regulator